MNSQEVSSRSPRTNSTNAGKKKSKSFRPKISTIPSTPPKLDGSSDFAPTSEPTSPILSSNPPSRPSSHHRRRSSVSTRRESAEMMNGSYPTESPPSHDSVDNRSLALLALEGKVSSFNFSTVEIPDWKSPDMEKSFDSLVIPEKRAPLTPFGINTSLAGKRDSFGKLLVSSSSLKKELQTLVEEEEEEEDFSNQPPLLSVVPPQFTTEAPSPPTTARPRPSNLNLRPLSLAVSPGPLPTPSPTPSPRLKSLTLAAIACSTPTPSRQLFASSPSEDSKLSRSPSERVVHRQSSIPYKSSPDGNSRVNIPYAPHTPVSRPGSASSSISNGSRPSSVVSQQSISFMHTPQSLPPSTPEPGPLSPTDHTYLVQSHVTLLSRITDLEMALAATHSNSPTPSEEILTLVADLKAERDELAQDVAGWRMRCNDLQKNISVLSKRIEGERREVWDATEKLGQIEVEIMVARREKQEAEEQKVVAENLADSLQDTLAKSEVSRRAAHQAKAKAETTVGELRAAIEGMNVKLINAMAELKRERLLREDMEKQLEFHLKTAATPTLGNPVWPRQPIVPNDSPGRRIASSVDSQVTQVEDTVLPDYVNDFLKFKEAMSIVQEEDDGEALCDEPEHEEDSEEDPLAHYESEDDNLSFHCASGGSSDFSRSPVKTLKTEISSWSPDSATFPSTAKSDSTTAPSFGNRPAALVLQPRTPGLTGWTFPRSAPATKEAFSPELVTSKALTTPSSPTTSHNRRSSLSSGWSFSQAPVLPKQKAEIDRFFSCLDDLDKDEDEDTSNLPSLPTTISVRGGATDKAHGFGKMLSRSEAEYGDDAGMPPFVIPTIASSSSLLPFISEESEGEVGFQFRVRDDFKVPIPTTVPKPTPPPESPVKQPTLSAMKPLSPPPPRRPVATKKVDYSKAPTSATSSIRSQSPSASISSGATRATVSSGSTTGTFSSGATRATVSSGATKATGLGFMTPRSDTSTSTSSKSRFGKTRKDSWSGFPADPRSAPADVTNFSVGATEFTLPLDNPPPPAPHSTTSTSSFRNWTFKLSQQAQASNDPDATPRPASRAPTLPHPKPSSLMTSSVTTQTQRNTTTTTTTTSSSSNNNLSNQPVVDAGVVRSPLISLATLSGFMNWSPQQQQQPPPPPTPASSADSNSKPQTQTGNASQTRSSLRARERSRASTTGSAFTPKTGNVGQPQQHRHHQQQEQQQLLSSKGEKLVSREKQLLRLRKESLAGGGCSGCGHCVQCRGPLITV